MSVFSNETIWTGDTYAIRAALKEFGGEWNATSKAWKVPALTKSERVQAERLAAKHNVTVTPAQ